MATKVIMPQLGESVVEGTVSRWLKQEGDTINEYEPLVEVSTDKVDTEIPSPAGGVILKIYVAEGTTVERGVLLALIGQPGEAVDGGGSVSGAHGHVAHSAQSNGLHSNATAPVRTAAAEPPKWHVTPVVARMAAEHGLDLSQIQGTGRDGRVTKKDVEAYLGGGHAAPAAEPQLAPWERPGSGDLFKPTVEYGATREAIPTPPPIPKPPPAPQPSPTPTPTPTPKPPSHAPDLPGELVALNNMRRNIAEHMVQSKLHTSPHVSTVFEIDMSAVLKARAEHKEAFAKQGLNLTLTAYFAAAAVGALQDNPYLNARWQDDGIYLIHTINLGIAVAMGTNPATNEGLIVPVIHNAQDLNLNGFVRAINDVSERARTKKLRPDDVQGGTFTISNHGVTGSLFATPIINQPQVAIMGIGMVEQRVKVINGMIAVRPCCYVSLTFDHRVVDGATGDAFMQLFKRTLESWESGWK